MRGDSLARWWNLTPRERLVTAQMFVLLAIAQIAVSWTRVATLLAWRVPVAGARRRDPGRLGALLEATASRHPLRLRCLPRAVTGWWVCRAASAVPSFVLGVRREGAGLRAHAWVTAGGAVVVGRTDVAYDVLLEATSGPAREARQEGRAPSHGLCGIVKGRARGCST